ncbi:hypothetical protein ACLG6S_01930 [Thermodesulfobacteriota bacterium B35]
MIRPAGERAKEKVQKTGQIRVGVWSNDDRLAWRGRLLLPFPLTWGIFFCNRAGCSLDALFLCHPAGSTEPAGISGTGTFRLTKNSPVPAVLPGTIFPVRDAPGWKRSSFARNRGPILFPDLVRYYGAQADCR